MLLLTERLGHFSHLKPEISDLKSLAESISRQLRAWADSLQNSAITGQRHLNEPTRQQYQHQRRSSEFWQKLEADHRRRIEGHITGQPGLSRESKVTDTPQISGDPNAD